MPRERRLGFTWGLPTSLAEVRFRDVAVIVVVGLTIWGYVDVAPHGRIEPGRLDRHKTDFTVYTEAASAFFDGRDSYRVTNPRGWHYLYPPLFALLVTPLTYFDSQSQVAAWYVISIGFGFGCYAEARRLWRLVTRGGPAPSSGFAIWVGTWALLAAALPTLDCLQRGQLGIALLYLLLMGSRLVLSARSWRRGFAGGVVLALAAVLKLVPLLPLGCLVFQEGAAALVPGSEGRRRSRTTALSAGILAGFALFLLAVPAAMIGWRKNVEALHRWATRVAANEKVGADANFDIHSTRNQSLANAVYLAHSAYRRGRLYGPPPGRAGYPAQRVESRAVGFLIGAALLGLLAVVATVGRRRDPCDQVMTFALACWATILASPLSWGHYYMVEVPALLCLPVWLDRRGWHRSARAVVVAPALLVWAHYVALWPFGFLGLLGLGTTAWYFTALGLIAATQLTARRVGAFAPTAGDAISNAREGSRPSAVPPRTEAA